MFETIRDIRKAFQNENGNFSISELQDDLRKLKADLNETDNSIIRRNKAESFLKELDEAVKSRKEYCRVLSQLSMWKWMFFSSFLFFIAIRVFFDGIWTARDLADTWTYALIIFLGFFLVGIDVYIFYLGCVNLYCQKRLEKVSGLWFDEADRIRKEVQELAGSEK